MSPRSNDISNNDWWLLFSQQHYLLLEILCSPWQWDCEAHMVSNSFELPFTFNEDEVSQNFGMW